MNYEEALEKVKDCCVGCADVTKCDDCEFPIIYKAIEKQIAKRPTKSVKLKLFVCPTCETFLHADKLYCSRCGQALDWSGEE